MADPSTPAPWLTNGTEVAVIHHGSYVVPTRAERTGDLVLVGDRVFIINEAGDLRDIDRSDTEVLPMDDPAVRRLLALQQVWHARIRASAAARAIRLSDPATLDAAQAAARDLVDALDRVTP